MARQPRQQPIGFYGKFQPTGVDNSAAQRMQALAGLGETVAGLSSVAEQFGIKKANELAPEQAAKAVADAITVDAEGKTVYGSVAKRTGWGSETFNREIISGYENALEADVGVNLRRIAIESENNQEQFITLSTAYLSGIQGATSMPREAQAMVANMVSAYSSDIMAKEIAHGIAMASASREKNLTVSKSDALRFVSNGNLVAGEDAKQRVNTAIDSRIGLDYDQFGADILKRDFAVEYQVGVDRAELKTVFENQGYLAALGFIEKKTDGVSQDWTVDEKEAYESVLMGDLKTQRVSDDLRETEMTENRELQQEGNAIADLVGIINGTVSGSDIATNAAKDNYSYTDAVSLLNIANNRGSGINDYSVIANITTEMYQDPDNALTLLVAAIENKKITGDTALGIIKTISENKAQQDVLKTPMVIKYSRHISNVIATDKDFMGNILDPDQRQRESEMQIVFAERVLAGEEPAIVAKSLIDANSAYPPERSEYWDGNYDSSIKLLDSILVSPIGQSSTYPNGTNAIEVLESQEDYKKALKKLKATRDSEIPNKKFMEDYINFTKG
jgi:hypothetical protein